MKTLERLAHSNVGMLSYTGEEISIAALCTAYLGHGGTPLLVSITGPKEIVNSLKQFAMSGFAMEMKLKAESNIGVMAGKSGMIRVASHTLPLTGQDHVILANRLLQGGQTKEKRIYIPVLNPQKPQKEVFARLGAITGSPFFPEWYDFLWGLGIATNLIMPVSHAYGMAAYTTVADGQWQAVIANALHPDHHLIPTISEVFHARQARSQ